MANFLLVCLLAGWGLAACLPAAGSPAQNRTPHTDTPAPAGLATGLPGLLSASAIVPQDMTPTPTPTVRFPMLTPGQPVATTLPASPAPVSSPVETPPATPLACWMEGGRYESGSLKAALLPLPLEFSVFLPPCYDQQPQRRYPVLYLIHGQSFNHDQWDRLGVDETANALVAAGELPPFLVVMPRDRSWEQPDKDMFGRVVAEELVPYVDQRYRSLPGRDFRAVGGLSRGAGWAVHLGLSRWDLFGAIGAHSLPVFWNDTSRIRGWLDSIPPESLPRIYMDIGEKDRPSIMQSALWFENLLTEKDIPHEWYLFQGYHEEAYWQAHVEDYLRWYARHW